MRRARRQTNGEKHARGAFFFRRVRARAQQQRKGTAPRGVYARMLAWLTTYGAANEPTRAAWRRNVPNVRAQGVARERRRRGHAAARVRAPRKGAQVKKTTVQQAQNVHARRNESFSRFEGTFEYLTPLTAIGSFPERFGQ